MSEFEPGEYVLGYVDSHGAVHARRVSDGESHTDAERVAGRMFRYCLCSQDFKHFWGGDQQRMESEDYAKVYDWLYQQGLLSEYGKDMADLLHSRINGTRG